MIFNVRLFCAAMMLVSVAACSKVSEDVASEDANLTEEQQIDKGAATLEEAADKAMQMEIDSLNNVSPRSGDESNASDADNENEAPSKSTQKNDDTKKESAKKAAQDSDKN